MGHAPALVFFGNFESDLVELTGAVAPLSWMIRVAETWRCALEVASTRAATVLIYDSDSNPAGWIDAFSATLAIANAAPSFVMISRFADDRL